MKAIFQRFYWTRVWAVLHSWLHKRFSLTEARAAWRSLLSNLKRRRSGSAPFVRARLRIFSFRAVHWPRRAHRQPIGAPKFVGQSGSLGRIGRLAGASAPVTSRGDRLDCPSCASTGAEVAKAELLIGARHRWRRLVEPMCRSARWPAAQRRRIPLMRVHLLFVINGASMQRGSSIRVLRSFLLVLIEKFLSKLRSLSHSRGSIDSGIVKTSHAKNFSAAHTCAI